MTKITLEWGDFSCHNTPIGPHECFFFKLLKYFNSLGNLKKIILTYLIIGLIT